MPKAEIDLRVFQQVSEKGNWYIQAKESYSAIKNRTIYWYAQAFEWLWNVFYWR